MCPPSCHVCQAAWQYQPSSNKLRWAREANTHKGLQTHQVFFKSTTVTLTGLKRYALSSLPSTTNRDLALKRAAKYQIIQFLIKVLRTLAGNVHTFRSLEPWNVLHVDQ